MNESEKVNPNRIIERDRANGYLVPRDKAIFYNNCSHLREIYIIRRIADAVEDLLKKKK